MVMDEAMMNRLDGIKRSYQALTERLGDPDVIADSNLLMKVMSDRSKSEDVVNAYEEVRSKVVPERIFLNEFAQSPPTTCMFYSYFHRWYCIN